MAGEKAAAKAKGREGKEGKESELFFQLFRPRLRNCSLSGQSPVTVKLAKVWPVYFGGSEYSITLCPMAQL